MKISVTKEHIDKAKDNLRWGLCTVLSRSCPVVYAIEDLGYKPVDVQLDYALVDYTYEIFCRICIWQGNKGYCSIHEVRGMIVDKIRRFDSKLTMEPFEFELDIPKYPECLQTKEKDNELPS